MTTTTKTKGTKFFNAGTQNQKILQNYWGTGKTFTVAGYDLNGVYKTDVINGLSGATATGTIDYKEIVSVQGRTEGSTFFGNISGYKVNGRIITIPKSFATVKIKYIISLITEKPIATKQASKDGEKEELSIVTTNTASV